MAVDPIPDGYHTITPYLIVKDAAALLTFLERGLGAEERFRMDDEAGMIRHAEVRVGDSIVMLAEATDQHPPMPAGLHLYVEDCDAWYRRALDAGAESLQEPTDQFYGDRTGGVRDSTGNLWWFATRVEDVSAEEMMRRVEEAAAG